MTAAAELSEVVSGAAERVGPAVVGLGRGWGLGSGVVIADGQVLTSAHNLRLGAVRPPPNGNEVTIAFADGEREHGEVAGSDPDLDLAVVSVDTHGIDPVAWEPDAAETGLGAPVVALANPGGRGLRATLGFVSSAGRSFRGPRGRRVEGAIEHTAPLPRGSSGGPLVDPDGRLLGLNSVRLEGGLILAVPATAAVRDRTVLLARGDAPRRPRLGIAIAPPWVARKMRRAVGLPERAGLLVRGVEDGSPAERAGIERGDLLVAAGERELDGVDALYAALDALDEGAKVVLTVVRGTEERDVAVGVSQEQAP